MPDIIETLKQTRKSIPPCIPPFWANGGHLQTILGHLLPSPKIKEEGTHLNITLEKESERIHSTYFAGNRQVVLYLFHGLGGSSEAAYMQRTAIQARRRDYHIFINNHRGCGRGMGLAMEPYHSGRAEDLSKVIEFGRQMLPEHKHIAIGFSLSANALLLLSAGIGASVKPDVSIAVNAPIHLDHASKRLQKGLNRIYDKRFVHELEDYMKKNRPHEVKDFSHVKDLRDFDEQLTAPLGGFKNREEYYEICSAKKYLSQIQMPTLILTSQDDPIVSFKDYREGVFSPMVVTHFEKYGGHMGYLSRKGLGYERWLDLALASYLENLQ